MLPTVVKVARVRDGSGWRRAWYLRELEAPEFNGERFDFPDSRDLRAVIDYLDE